MNETIPPVVESAEAAVQVNVAPSPKKRGFAALDPELVRELARRGGTAAHRAGTAHEFTREEAKVAGRKGGLAAHLKRLANQSSN